MARVLPASAIPYSDPVRPRLGEELVSRSLLNRRDLAAAIQHSERLRTPLADAVVDLGLVTEDESYATLAHCTGLRLADLSEQAPSDLALRLVPERIARKHLLLPLAEDNRLLTYATSRPFDDEAERDVAFASGRRPQAVVARRSDLVAALDRYYRNLSDIDLLLERVRSTSRVEMMDASESEMLDLHESVTRINSPAIDLCKHIIARAVEAGATDVHLEPAQHSLTVHYRLRGVLEPAITLPAEAAISVRNRYKVMARVGIAVKHRAQHGTFRLLVSDRAIDVTLSTLPTIHGERIVMRVIDSRAAASTPTIHEFNRASPAASTVATTSHQGHRVLVVDDDRITRMLVTLLMEKDGYQVIEAENGRQAVDIANRERPDLLLIDLLMPDMDGYEAIVAIRKNVSLSTLPVMVLTAEDGATIEHRVLELGADDYLVKPFEAPVLASRVRAMLRRAGRAVAA